jgi:hypothetical protein
MQTTTRLRRLPALLAAALCLLLTLACGSGSGAASRPAPTAAPASDAAAAAPLVIDAVPVANEAAPAAYGVGQDVQVDEMRWKIVAAEDAGQTLKSDNEFIPAKKTSGRFVRVRFELENLSKDMLTFAGLDLLDGQGRTFKSASDAFAFIPEDESCVLENLNPNVAKTCTAIYEVPANAGGLQAQVSDLKMFGGQQALVDLGLK